MYMYVYVYLHNPTKYLYSYEVTNVVYVGIVSHTQQQHTNCTTCNNHI